jgi:hypothetical protein
MALRPELRRVADDLLARGRSLTLDEVAEAIGELAISSDEIDELLSEVEAHAEVDSAPPVAARESLSRVLASARTLKSELARAPSPDEIAKHSGLSRDSVRLALLYARTLAR